MKNIYLWQYFVIAGPAAVAGGLVVWFVNREYIRGIEYILLNYEDMKEMSAAEIIKSIKQGL